MGDSTSGGTVPRVRQAAEPPQSPGSLLYVLYVLYGSYTPSRTPTVSGLLPICAICAIWVLHAKPRNLHSPPGPCYMYYMCYIILYAL